MPYYTYILQSKKDQRRYIGSAEDIERRLKSHNEGLVDATIHRRPLELLCYREFATRAEAVQFEKYLKSLKGGKTFKRILKELSMPM